MYQLASCQSPNDHSPGAHLGQMQVDKGERREPGGA